MIIGYMDMAIAWMGILLIVGLCSTYSREIGNYIMLPNAVKSAQSNYRQLGKNLSDRWHSLYNSRFISCHMAPTSV